jgi:hypothetical protein
MNRTAALLALGVTLIGKTLIAQPSTPSSAPASPPCLPTTTLDELIKAIDDAVSGAGDKDRACFRDVMVPDARLIPVGKAQDGTFAPHVLTVDGWIDAVRKRGSAVFYERQVKVKSEQFGHIANLWSTYEVRPTPDGNATVRGINSIQAVFDGTRWKVIEILWQAETAAEPVPEKYLP